MYIIIEDSDSKFVLNHETLKKTTEFTDEILPVHNMANMKLNRSICLYFCTLNVNKSAANLKRIANLIVSTNTSTLLMESCADQLDYRIRKLLD
jgi:hypothetical protein